MKITKLEKKKRLYLLELDNDQKLYITEDTIVKYFLSKNKEISEEELKEIQEFAQYSYGKNLALEFPCLKLQFGPIVKRLLHSDCWPNVILFKAFR